MCVRSIVKAELIFFTYITLIWKLQPLIKNVLLCVSLLISQESFLECLEKVWGKFDFRFLCHAYCVKTQIFGDTLIPVFVNENCCLRKCFTKLYFFYWLLVVSLEILIAVPLSFFVVNKHRLRELTQNAARIKRFLRLHIIIKPVNKKNKQ